MKKRVVGPLSGYDLSKVTNFGEAAHGGTLVQSNPFRTCRTKNRSVKFLSSPELLGKLGGVTKVRKAFPHSAISVIPLGLGVCIRVGETPQLGDRSRKDDLPLYRKVGSYLKKYRGRPEIELTGLNEKESELWLARFDS